MRKRLAFIGAGSFSDGVLPWIDETQFDFMGYFDDKPIDQYRGYPILGRVSEAYDYLSSGQIDCVFVTIGDNAKRQEIFEAIAHNHYSSLINIISPKAHLMDLSSIAGRGIFIGFSSFIGADVLVQDNCIINTGAIIEHHTTIEKHCNIAPSATINGLCHIEEGVFVGSGSVIIQMIRVAKQTVLGAGAVVVKSIEESGTYVGVPARKLT